MKRPKIDFATWRESDPFPELAELVKRFGSWGAITAEAWAEHDQAVAHWKARYCDRFRPPYT